MANTYVNNEGERLQKVIVEVWVPERLIEFVMKHTGRSRRAARRHIADSYLHHGGELTWCDGDCAMVIDKDGQFLPVHGDYYADDKAQDLISKGYIPYLDDDGNLVDMGAGLHWELKS